MKTLAAAAVVLTLVSGCERGSKPNPKPQKTHVVDFGATVKMCLTPPHMLREEEKHCEAGTEGYAWIWVKDSSIFPEELPAVGGRLQQSRGDWYAPPPGTLVVTIPKEGARFTRNPPLWVTPKASL
jgi:hypothetical protein